MIGFPEIVGMIRSFTQRTWWHVFVGIDLVTWDERTGEVWT